jgi:hypothetical protein
VAWTKAEVIIDAAKQADFLLIFDCCFAGRLAGPSSRKAISKRNFDFLGASGANEITRTPGERSFTHALIKALESLAHDTDGFTTTELYLKVLECPTFPKQEQTPCYTSRTNCLERLLLAPLDVPDSMSASTASISRDNSQSSAIRYCLTLDFLLTNLPTEDDMTTICDSLKSLVTKRGLPAQKFIWNNMYRKGEEVPAVAKAAALSWLAQTLRNGSRSNRRSSSLEESGSAKTNMMHLAGKPEPFAPAAFRHEVLQATFEGADRLEGMTDSRGDLFVGKEMRSRFARQYPFICWCIMLGGVLGVLLLYSGCHLLPCFDVLAKSGR